MPGSAATCSTLGQCLPNHRSAPTHSICAGAGCVEATGLITSRPIQPDAGSPCPAMPGWHRRGWRPRRAGRPCSSRPGWANWTISRARNCWSGWKWPGTVPGKRPSGCSRSPTVGRNSRLDNQSASTSRRGHTRTNFIDLAQRKIQPAIKIPLTRHSRAQLRPDDEEPPWLHPRPRRITRVCPSPCTG